MSVKLRASSGSYNVRASELASQVHRPGFARTVSCVVYFLDDTEASFEIDKRAKAGSLLEKVFEHLELIEKDYFGLQFLDVGPNAEGMPAQQSPSTPVTPPGQVSPTGSSSSGELHPVITTDVMRWLDPLKTLKKQIRVGPPYTFFFRVKFYVSDPSKLQEEYTRYHFFLQVKKDIYEGKLMVPYKTAVLLASYAVQSELGDYHPDEHRSGYLVEFRFMPTTPKDFEGDVCELHKQHKGLNPADSEFRFLEKVAEIETYGVDLHHAYWDQSNVEIQLGVTSIGLVVFQNNIRINTFSWSKIVKISFKRKQFFIQLRKEVNDNVENLIGFNMASYRSCKNLWKSCVEHHTFFRLHSPPQPKSSIFSIGSKFRYSENEKSPVSEDEPNGRTEFQTLEDGKRRARIERTFTRSPSKRYARRTVGATTRDAIMTERNAIDGYNNTPHSSSVDNFNYVDRLGQGSRGSSPQKLLPGNHIPNSSSYPLAFPSSRGGNMGGTGFSSQSNSHSNSSNSTTSPVHGNHSNHQNSSHIITPATTTSAIPTSTTNSFQHSAVRSTLPNDYKSNSYLTKSSTAQQPQNGGWTNSSSNNTPQSTLSHPSTRTLTPQPQPVASSGDTTADSSSTLSRSYDSRSLDRKERRRTRGIQNKADYRISQTLDTREQNRLSRGGPAAAATPTGDKTKSPERDESGGFLNHQQRQRQLQSSMKKNHNAQAGSTTTSKEAFSSPNSTPAKLANSMDDTTSNITDHSYEMSTYSEYSLPNGNAYSSDSQGLVTIKMKPDAQGRFGFNVKGGKDQGMPIIVSRVAPGTPADICIPRLNEGDQVLYINGRDVSNHNHEQVVMFIRASRERHSGELVLVVRPNVYIGDDTLDTEPEFQYIPDTHHISTTLPPGGDALDASLMLLSEGLESGAALAQFDQLYRKKPGMTMNAARLDANLPKNRYRDISPYDQTRVKIKTSAGDYINGNFVNMEIPGSGIINRYIAAQGPLPNTSGDFWQMVWEQHATLVVMLTTNVEQGRVKCHQYWPQLYETNDLGNLQVVCLKEEQTQSFAFREFTLTNKNDKSEERHITQMQYISWPDHGVPDEAGDFLDFVQKVRQRRAGMTEPTVVHCSAGIGRTGVLITMETAMCLIEANHPVYPLDIVRQMRDQRAMLIQTSIQYKFVCEAILKVYNEKIVQPLEEYKR